VTDFRSALLALEEAGVDVRLRKAEGGLPAEGELDVWIDAGDARRADRALRGAGFKHLGTAGHLGHTFYVAFDRGRWLKLDAKAPSTHRRPLSRVASSLQRRMPVSLRRLGPVIAVLGPDGAGKGSLISGLRARIPFAVTPVYLGMDKRRSRRAGSGVESPRNVPAWREVAGLGRGLLRSWRLLAGAYAAAWRGDIVLCDRHPIEVLAVRPRRTPLAAAAERLLVQRLIPRPDAVVVLDAPGDVLFRRKREHPVEVLERWRRAYAEVFGPMGAVIIPTAGPMQATLGRASQAVWEALGRRRRW
jgi:ribose 1,5-bisphosphokinase PhnN